MPLTSLTRKVPALSTLTLQVLLILAGEVLNVMAFHSLIVPAKLMNGGVVGIALLLNRLLALPIGLQTILYNIPIFWLGYRYLGRRFVALSVLGVLSFSLMMDNVTFPVITREPMLIAIFGGLLTGLADGLIIRMGGSTGGFDILGLIVSRRSGLPVGRIFMVFNGLLIGLAAFIFNSIELAMYTLIMMFVSSTVIDTVLTSSPRRVILVISEQHALIAQWLMAEINRGVTYLEGVGAYTEHEYRVLMCVVTRFEMVEVKRKIREIDPTAFAIVIESPEVIGRFDSNSLLQRWLR